MRLYRQGDSGEPVRDIQGRLTASGFDCGGDESGEFGEGSLQAVVEFQRSRNLDPDGIVGPETWRVLVEAGYRLGDRLLYHRLPMLRGEDVADLQRRLNSLGFDAGKVDGIFGPDTLRALLDFQSNRNMAEDGIGGPEVAHELALVERATHKQGREVVRELQWLRERPRTVAGLRILVDAFTRDQHEDALAWEAAVGAAKFFQHLGANVVMSRTADSRPPERVRARRANRLGAELVVSFSTPRGEPGSVFYFASRHGASSIGALLAAAVAERLGLQTQGRSTPMLKETRPPAVIVAADTLDADAGRRAADAVAGFFASDDAYEASGA